jgi:hypothetical protein
MNSVLTTGIALAFGLVVMARVVMAQTVTPTPTPSPSPTVTPTPTQQVLPEGSPQTGFGGMR